MTTKELQKRNEKAQNLRVLQANGTFFVESAEGMVLYKVTHDGNGKYSCTCGDYARGIKQDPNFQCKHVLSVLNSVAAGDAEDAEFLERKKPKLDERFIKTIEGRDFVLYSGLLDLAHQKGLLKIEVEPLQYPTKENGYFAICKATALSKFGEVFQDVGDANQTNCNSKVSKHLLRMASTRAKARALRDMTNIGLTALEELGDLDEVLGDDAGNDEKTKRSSPRKPARPPESKPHQETKAEKENGSDGGSEKPATNQKETPKQESKPESAPKMSSAQKNAIYNLSRRRGISVEELENMTKEKYGVPLESLSSSEASSFIRSLQQSA